MCFPESHGFAPRNRPRHSHQSASQIPNLELFLTPPMSLLCQVKSRQHPPLNEGRTSARERSDSANF